MKTRDYTSARVEVCRNCGGSGVVLDTPPFHPHGRENEAIPRKCPVCVGSGRVRKRLEIKVTIEPFQLNTT